MWVLRVVVVVMVVVMCCASPENDLSTRIKSLSNTMNSHFKLMNSQIRNLDTSISQNVEAMENKIDGEVAKINGSVMTMINDTKRDTMQELRDMATAMEALNGKMQDLETGLQVVVEVVKTMQPTPPPPTPTPGELFPCEDSTFNGTYVASVCQLAAQFNKCHLEAVAYHCCHTCTAQRKLPEMGPWRYVNRSRDVSTIDIDRFGN